MANMVIIEKTKQLLSGHCAAELRVAAQAWLDALDTENEAAATDEYIFQLQDGIIPVDELIAFTGSDMGKATFGEETAAQFHAHGLEIKEKGGEWCDCPACSTAIEILGLFDDEDEAGRMVLEFEDDTTVECDIVCLFDLDDKTCIVLLPDDESGEVLIYGYKDLDDDNFELYDLSDEEFSAASEAFDKLLAE